MCSSSSTSYFIHPSPAAVPNFRFDVLSSAWLTHNPDGTVRSDVLAVLEATEKFAASSTLAVLLSWTPFVETDISTKNSFHFNGHLNEYHGLSKMRKIIVISNLSVLPTAPQDHSRSNW
jgi:hypothetical protein